MLSGLEFSTIARDEYQEIFNNVSDGLFLIDSGCRICPNYSTATAKILGTKDLQGKNIKHLFEGMLAPEKSARFNEYITLMFDAQHHERAINAMNPLQATHFRVTAASGLQEPRLLDFSFFRIWDGSKKRIVHVMAVVRDNTRLGDMAKELRTLRSRLVPVSEQAEK